MQLLFKTTDPTVVSYVKDLLAQEDILAFVMDENISIVDGSINIFPRRVMVSDVDYDKAREIILNSEAASELGQ